MTATITTAEDAAFIRAFMAPIVAHRIVNGLRRREVADRMGILTRHVRRIETCRADIHMSTLRRYALAVGVVIEWRVVAIPDCCEDHAPALTEGTTDECELNVQAVVERLTTYLDEMDRVDAANVGAAHYGDEVHGINDHQLRRSDLRTLLGAQALVTPDAIRLATAARDLAATSPSVLTEADSATLLRAAESALTMMALADDAETALAALREAMGRLDRGHSPNNPHAYCISPLDLRAAAASASGDGALVEVHNPYRADSPAAPGVSGDDDTPERLQRAVARLEEKRDQPGTRPSERDRLNGKIEGVKLAASYMAERVFSPGGTVTDGGAA